MRAKIEFVGEHNILTSGDELSAEVVIKRSHDEPYFTTLVSEVELRLVCEGNFEVVANGQDLRKVVTYYESEPVLGRCNYTTRGHVIYSGHLRFPSDEAGLPSSMTYAGRKSNTIQWVVRALIIPAAGRKKHRVERSCTFRPSAPLPSLLNLVDVDHSDIVDDTQVTLTTTHAAAGLPQVPLASGLSFKIECDRPGKFSLTRLRVLLREYSEITIGTHRRHLPVRRWLLEEFRPRSEPLSLAKLNTSLYNLIGDIQIDHSTLAPTFETPNLFHGFDLVTEVTLAWTVGGGARMLKKLSSVSPVDVLPRMTGAGFGNLSNVAVHGSDHAPHVIFDPAEITDTTDDELDSSELGDVSCLEDIEPLLSPESVRSVFSDHMKKMNYTDSEPEKTPPIITTTSYFTV